MNELLLFLIAVYIRFQAHAFCGIVIDTPTAIRAATPLAEYAVKLPHDRHLTQTVLDAVDRSAKTLCSKRETNGTK